MFRPAKWRPLRALWFPAYSNTVFVAGADGQAFLKNLPQNFKSQPNQPTTFDTATWQGQWKSDGEQLQCDARQQRREQVRRRHD